jgi:LemA protein
MKKKLSGGIIALIVIGAILLMTVLWVAMSYNGLVRADETVSEKWANVQSAYQRRADLVPNLVATVQGAVNFEKDTQTKIAALRSGAVTAQQQMQNARTPAEIEAADQKVSEQLTAFRALNINVENYPQLKATENFLSLQDELAGTENRIKTERDIFNQATKDYNIKVRRFPTNILAGMFGFGQKDMFAANEGSENAPNVGNLFQ